MTHTATKTKSAGLFTLLALLTALATGCSKEAPEVEPIDLAQAPDLFEQPLQPSPLALTATDVVITVNGKEITHGEVVQATQMQMMRLSGQVPPQQIQQLYPQVYQEMSKMLVANILLTQAAEKSSLVVSEEALASEITRIEANVPEGKTLKEALAETEVDVEEWKENLRKQMLIGKLVEEKTANTEAATAVEANEFYQANPESFKVPETVSASHILMGFTPEDTDETKAKKKADLTAVREQILAGGSFEELAAQHSSCPSSQQGGSLGSFARGQMVPEFEEAAFGMATNTISDVVETQFGYHIIKVTGQQTGSVRTLTEVQDQILAYLTNQKKQASLTAYIDQLMEKADVVTHSQNFDAAAEKEEKEEEEK